MKKKDSGKGGARSPFCHKAKILLLRQEKREKMRGPKPYGNEVLGKASLSLLSHKGKKAERRDIF